MSAQMDTAAHDQRGPSVSTVTIVGAGEAIQGRPAPIFAWKTAAGETRSLEDYKGKVVLLNFWGTWCPPCRRELPDIVRLREEYKAKGFEVVGICLERADDPIGVVKEFAASNGLVYPLVIGNDALVAAYGGIQAVPTTFIVDRKGILREGLVGMQSATVFREAIERAM